MQNLIEWLEAHSLPCFYVKYFGIECPGCGIQTAFILLLKGHFVASFKTYPALFPFLFLMAYLVLHLIFKFKNGPNVLKYTFIFTTLIMIVNYIKNLIL